MIKLISNRRGFALAMILGLLPILFGGFFTTSLAIGVIQSDLKLKFLCRSEGLRAQEKVGHHLQKLMSLNPRAAQLRLQIQSARIALAAAIAAQNPVAVTKLSQRIAHLTKLQSSLDIRQKQLINESNRELSTRYHRTQGLLRTNGAQALNSFPGLLFKFENRSGKLPRLAVEPDNPGLAPLYRLQTGFEQKQTLAHRWQFQLVIRPPISRYIGTNFSFEKSCLTTLRQKGLIWVPKITKDKF